MSTKVRTSSPVPPREHTPGEQWLAFQLDAEGTVSVTRAAQALRLEWETTAGGTVFVYLRDAVDAYRLAEHMVGDPVWAKLLLRWANRSLR